MQITQNLENMRENLTKDDILEIANKLFPDKKFKFLTEDTFLDCMVEEHFTFELLDETLICLKFEDELIHTYEVTINPHNYEKYMYPYFGCESSKYKWVLRVTGVLKLTDFIN